MMGNVWRCSKDGGCDGGGRAVGGMEGGRWVAHLLPVQLLPVRPLQLGQQAGRAAGCWDRERRCLRRRGATSSCRRDPQPADAVSRLRSPGRGQRGVFATRPQTAASCLACRRREYNCAQGGRTPAAAVPALVGRLPCQPTAACCHYSSLHPQPASAAFAAESGQTRQALKHRHCSPLRTGRCC